MRSKLMPHLIGIFGVVLLVFGCTTAQKQTATKALVATTQATTNVQNAAATVASVTPPGSLPNDLAQTVIAITGALLVLERIGNTVVAALPNKTGNPVNDLGAVANAVSTALHDGIPNSNPNPTVPVTFIPPLPKTA